MSVVLELLQPISFPDGPTLTAGDRIIGQPHRRGGWWVAFNWHRLQIPEAAAVVVSEKQEREVRVSDARADQYQEAKVKR